MATPTESATPKFVAPPIITEITNPGTQPCGSCGTPVASANVLYTAEALAVCARCFANDDLLATDKRAARNIRSASIMALVAGVIAIFAPLGGSIAVGASCLVAFSSAIFAVQSMTPRNLRFTKHLTGGDKTMIWIFSILGMALAAFTALGTWVLFLY